MVRCEVKMTDPHTRKKNQDKGELEGKRKAKGDEVVREMYDSSSVYKRVQC